MNKIFGKIFLVTVLGCLFLSLVPAQAADATFVDPSFNSICWTEKDCTMAREKIFGVPAEEAKKGFFPNLYPCVKTGWGKCLPAGATKTSISFGGKTEFTDIGDYLVTIYNYALRIAAILAVIMIIIAGVQYVTSGGNSEMVSSAKKRIGGSLIGLFIAYMSYFILNSINPNLVNLRLPQVYLIRPLSNTAEFCVDLPKETFVAPVPDGISTVDQLDSAKMKTAFAGVTDFPTLAESLKTGTADRCGKMYFVKDSPALSCYDDFCKDGICVQDGVEAGKYKCLTGARMAGKVVNSSFLSGIDCVSAALSRVEGWNWPWIVGATTGIGEGIASVCNNGSSSMAKGSVNIEDLPGDKEQSYKVNLSIADVNSLATTCEGDKGGLKGFGLFMYINELCHPESDEVHMIGRSGVDLGNIDRIKNADGMFMESSDRPSERASKLKKELFFTADEIKKGIRLRIDVGDVHDIDEQKDMDVYNSLMD